MHTTHDHARRAAPPTASRWRAHALSALIACVSALVLSACGGSSAPVVAGQTSSGAGEGLAPVDSDPLDLPGACCLASGCAARSAAACAGEGGVFVDGACGASTCSGDVPDPISADEACQEIGGFCEDEGDEDEGACCLAEDNMCWPDAAVYCAEDGGAFFEGADCSEACPELRSEEDCEEDPDLCEDVGDEDEGACCWDDVEACELLPADVCADEGGRAHNALSCAEACPGFEVYAPEPEGACCLPERNACLWLWDEACSAYGGQLAAERACEDACPDLEDISEVEPACCFSEDGETFCEELPPLVCMFEEGTVVEGAVCSADPCGR